MNSDLRHALKIHIRWMIRRDMPEVLAIESESFEFPWWEERFLALPAAAQLHRHGGRAGRPGVGFMIYELHKIAAARSEFRGAFTISRSGVGSHMVTKLIGKLSTQRRNRILLEVRETNLAAQLFFRNSGFRAVSVLARVL